MQRFFRAAAGGLLAITLTGAGAASGQDTVPLDGIEALKECRAIAQDADRLACHDRVSGNIVEAAGRGEIRILTQKDVEETRRGLFGFTLPKMKLFGSDREDDREQLDRLESVVTSARQIDPKTYVFKIKDGDATWQIKEAPSRFIGPKAGDKVVFKSASLGSYFIFINNQVGIRGRRIN